MSQLAQEKAIALYGENGYSSLLLIPRLLEHIGYTTIIAESGEDILEKAKHYLPDMIVLDLRDEDNLEICQRLKVDEQVKNIPVIVLLPSSKIDLRDKVIKAGAANCLIKPIDVDDFQTVLKTYHPGE
jgi:CheY-like chemotaxis protein